MATSFGFSGESNRLHKIVDSLQKHFYTLCNAVGALFMTLGADFTDTTNNTQSFFDNNASTIIDHYVIPIVTNNWVLLIIGFFIFTFGLIQNNRDAESLLEENKKLHDENLQIDSIKAMLNASKEENEVNISKLQDKHEELVQLWLKTLYDRLDLTAHDRFTIYFVHNKEFTLLARYSSNPKIREVHNQKFPLNKGVISLCWQYGKHREIVSPTFTEDAKEYKQYMKINFGYPQEKIEKLTMKSNKYFALSIRDVDDTLGVILFESDSDSDIESFDAKSETIARYCHRFESYLSKFVKDAIHLDRLSNIKPIGESVDDEVLKILGGKQ